MSNTPIISIVMPTYNVAPFLRECLDSIRAQVFTDWECICVDDGSTDDTPAILDEYATSDPRFRVVRHEHSNAGACRNAGMDLARGRFLQFLDSDDVFAQIMLKRLLSIIEQYHADIATCDMASFRDGDSIPLFWKIKSANPRVFNHPAKTMDIFQLWVGRPWDKLFRKSFVDRLNLRFQEIHSTNDEYFIDLAVASASRIVHVADKLVAYRQHNSSLQATQSKDPRCIIVAIEAIYDEMVRRGLFFENPTLFRCFRAWAARCAWRLFRTGTIDAYSALHQDFVRICEKYHLGELSREDIPASEEDYRWFQTICQKMSPLDTLWVETQNLRTEVRSLRPLRRISRSYDYRIGRILTWFPRIIKCHL